jgi:tripartite-type tricarboxylate transporter receptor subunit TctC
LPDLRTAHEQGLADFEAYTWNAFFLPKGTPEPIARKLHQATLQAMDSSAVRDRLQGLGAMLVSPDRRTPDYLARFVESEISKWAEPIRSSGVSVE